MIRTRSAGAILALEVGNRFADLVSGILCGAPPFDLDPFAFFKILVMFEEMTDLQQQQAGQVGGFPDIVIQRRRSSAGGHLGVPGVWQQPVPPSPVRA